MVIKFLCPNGHQLSAPENMAGKKGKCPKCQSAFVVPTLEEVAAAEAEESAESAPMGTGAVSASEPVTTPAMGSGKGLPPGELFVFLCPNGHRLNGPPSLKGKAGQCPHCGARFRIPTGDEEEEEEQEEPEPMQVVVGGGESSETSGSGGFRFPIEQFMGEDQAAESKGPPAGPAGMGFIFARLWNARDERTELEIFLHEGEILVPEHYSELLSTSDYGVFAIQEGDGTYAITTIPWSSVRRVAMRKLDELPGELFS